MFYRAMLKKKKNKKAFTLIELIVVIAIIGVLVAILVPTMSGFVNNAKTTTANANAKTVFTVAQAQAQQQMVGGTTVADGTYTDATTDNYSKAVKAAVSSLATNAHYSITVLSGVVTKVTYTDSSGITGTYQ